MELADKQWIAISAGSCVLLTLLSVLPSFPSAISFLAIINQTYWLFRVLRGGCKLSAPENLWRVLFQFDCYHQLRSFYYYYYLLLKPFKQHLHFLKSGWVNIWGAANGNFECKWLFLKELHAWMYVCLCITSSSRKILNKASRLRHADIATALGNSQSFI